MPVTFTTDDYGDIILLGDVALAMLRVPGHSPTAPGAMPAAGIPARMGRDPGTTERNGICRRSWPTKELVTNTAPTRPAPRAAGAA